MTSVAHHVTAAIFMTGINDVTRRHLLGSDPISIVPVEDGGGESSDDELGTKEMEHLLDKAMEYTRKNRYRVLFVIVIYLSEVLLINYYLKILNFGCYYRFVMT